MAVQAEATRGFIPHEDLRVADRSQVPTLASPGPSGPTGDVELYELGDLVQLADARQRPATGLLRQLLNARSSHEREEVIQRRLDDIGFEWLAYSLASPANGSIRRSCLITFAHKEWTRSYFKQSFHELDPRQEQVRQFSLPLAWDIEWIEDLLADRTPTPRLRSFTQGLRDSGMGSGVFVRVPGDGQPSAPHGVVSLGSSMSSRRWVDDRVLGESLVISLSLHHYISRHVQLPEESSSATGACLHAASLPPRQQAVLRHVAGGLTDRAIAEKLGVSLHTVDYYLRQLRQHFGVHNRVQLLSAAAAHVPG